MFGVLILILIIVIFTAFGQISMKTGMNQFNGIKMGEMLNIKNFFNIFTNFYIVLGIVLYFLGLFIWLSLLSKFEVGSLYPLLSLTYIVTAIFGVIFLKEKLTFIKSLGISLIVLGSFLIIRS